MCLLGLEVLGVSIQHLGVVVFQDEDGEEGGGGSDLQAVLRTVLPIVGSLSGIVSEIQENKELTLKNNNFCPN